MLNFDYNPATVILHGRVGNWVAGTHAVEGDGLSGAEGELELAAYEGRVYELMQGETS